MPTLRIGIEHSQISSEQTQVVDAQYGKMLCWGTSKLNLCGCDISILQISGSGY